jgi:hypothetical protein
MCPHTTKYVSLYYYICVLILLYMCPHTLTAIVNHRSHTIYVLSYYCIYPHTTIYVSSYSQGDSESPHSYYICVLILLYMCPHTTICVLILLYMCPHTLRAIVNHRIHTIYVFSYNCICVLILLCMCPHTTISVSSYYYMCPHILLYMCPHTLRAIVNHRILPGDSVEQLVSPTSTGIY